MIREWLDKCNSIERLDPAINCKTKYSLRNTEDYLPISFEKLKVENSKLYHYIYSLL
jgi:hypothetical protein